MSLLFNTTNPALQNVGVHKNLLYALGVTLMLVTAGAMYVWQEITPTPDSAGLRFNPIAPPPTPANDVALVVEPTTITPPINATAAAPTSATQHAARLTRPANTAKFANASQHVLDKLLNQAYQEYRAGNFDLAQPHYHAVLAQAPHNTDALLGLAAIAQHHHADAVAADYYAKVLAHDVHNALAQAQMSALTNDLQHENRLRNLLAEQPNSTSLHAALGNYYAEQARWSEAQQSYFNAYQLAPNNAEFAFNLAVSLERLGQKKLAAQYYQHAIAHDQNELARFDHTDIALHAQQLSE